MADLIDRQAALAKSFDIGAYSNVVSAYDLATLPSVDAVEVVLCKDCEHRGKLYRNHLCDHPKAILSRVTDTDFCSYGERRIDNG